MKKAKQKIAAILAMACALSITSGMSFDANAQEISGNAKNVLKNSRAVSLPPEGNAKRGETQPFQHGYRSVDILNWSPQNDPYAEALRSHVPLQERIDSFADTQANPNLNPDTSLTNLNGDYGNYFFDSNPYTNEFSQYAYNFWQYTDYYGGWHGMATDGVPLSLYTEGDLENPKFEFGILNLPNPAYTNAAHKNGTKSIGCLFIPRAGQPYDALLQKDENGEYIIAKKLIEIKEYFGFDGYFINQETSISPDHIIPYKEFTKVLVDAGVYTQWYDCVDDEKGKLTYKPSLLPSHSSFVQDSSLGRVNDSIFMNYNWNSPDGWNNGDSTNPQYIDASVAEANRIGIDPLDSVLMGVEVAMGKFDGSHNSTRNMDVILDENGNPKTGIALFTPDYVKAGLDEDLGDTSQNRRGDDNYQWMVAERERMFYTGVTIDPLDTGEKEGYSRPDVGLNDASQWGGVSRYITERSVIDGNTFYSNFNTGHGMNYYKDGQISNNEEWSNMNIQDILPTWQWWIDTEGSKLQVDFDYGDEINNGEKFTYKQIGAYEGGSSLVINGDIDSKNYLRLFKSEIDITKKTTASVTFNKVSGSGDKDMQLGLIFKDSPDTVEYVDVKSSKNNKGTWQTIDVDLSKFAGRELATIGIAFDKESEKASNYQMNIGEIKITDNKNYTPNKPQNFSISEYLNTNEAYVTWDMESYDSVKQYNLYAQTSDNKNIYLGGVYDNLYYIKNLPKNTKSLSITAVGTDGSESKATSISFNSDALVNNLNVNENDESLEVSWSAVNSNFKNIKVEVFLDNSPIFEKVIFATDTSISIPIEKGDGRKYKVNVSTMKNKNKIEATTSVRGVTKDTFALPYDDEIKIKDNKLEFITPKNKDWRFIDININDTSYKYERGLDELNKIDLPSDGTKIDVTITDYTGNISETKKFIYLNGSIETDKEEILNAWSEGVDYKIGDIVEFNGITYECLQAHSSIVTWEPNVAVSLWKQKTNAPIGNTWSADIDYNVGDIVEYDGINYKCLQAHSSIVTWEPNVAVSLWEKQ